MITLTLIRHGESEDNNKTNWSGWKDAPLTALGEHQADALGAAFNVSSTRFQHFYTSDLRRAHSTALAVTKHHADPKPPLKVTQKLRGQCYGVAEGMVWVPLIPEGKTTEECYAEGIFPILLGRGDKFPKGECLNDVAQRAEDSLKEYILPHVFDKSRDGTHIGLTSHGLFIFEMLRALLRLDPDNADIKQTQLSKGLNTSWSRIEISVKDGYEGECDLNSPPPLHVQLVTFNNSEHLDTVAVPSPTPMSEASRAFFSGAGLNP